MKYRAAGCLMMAAMFAVSPVHAQDQTSDGQDQVSPPVLRGLAIDPSLTSFVPHVPAPSVSVLTAPTTSAASPASLAVYGIYGVIQVLDVHSTQRAISGNGVEANPFLRPFASSPAALITLKAASGAGIVYLMERVRKKHPAAALALAIGINSVQAMVVMHNYRVARR